ncbi:aldose epimerase [Pseudoalteromonas porphyrae]|uniref:Putative glucose-6-phosphate 1-epimerase n=1 Tax=Pseudoalteromonas neustonica TaxID=1840331 RepID=A0ABU9TWM0_9GAMM|nr:MULTISPECIES: D-hexose-6-phosphate mutarotase [Pseudoalteromonas]KPH93871.1 aldose epimerase [Pseudoalteromonas porphyrae]NMR24680.1 D-hexose-6-phosphate mutarotase [Pseudoalteromonas sp. NEC-BIFX-2020_015]
MKLSPSVSIEQTDSGLEYINVASEFCSAKIFLQGAQLTEFTPSGKKPLIWVSSEEDYQEGKGIRGGIPICWPWFGVNPNPEWPIHGVARTSLWRADEVAEQDDEIKVSLTLPMAQVDETYWPHKSKLKVEFILTSKLEVRLTTTNLSSETITFTQALHTYFPTPSIVDTKVDGLQGSKYIEFDEGPFDQNELVGFARETDMVYTQASETQRIITPDGIIEVGRENSSSCVLWNPWIDKSKRLSNFADDEYHTMLCLEAANVMNDSAVVAPGESHTLATTISWV